MGEEEGGGGAFTPGFETAGVVKARVYRQISVHFAHQSSYYKLTVMAHNTYAYER